MERVRAPARGARKEPLSYLRTACRYDKEVIEFVKALLEHDRIDLDKKKKGAVASPPGATDGKRITATHAIESVGGKKVLTRVRLFCGHH